MAVILLQKWLGGNGFKTMITGKNTFRTSEAAFAVDRNGQIVAWNQAAKRTFGYTKSRALGKRCWELLSGRDIFGNQSCCEGCPVRAAAFVLTISPSTVRNHTQHILSKLDVHSRFEAVAIGRKQNLR